MTDTPPVFEASGLDGVGFSEDRKTVRLTLGAAQLTVPIKALPALHEHLGQIIQVCREMAILPALPPTIARNMVSWQVGASNVPATENMMALLFDEKLPTETLLICRQLDGLRMADAIEQLVFAHMSTADQKAILRQVEAERQGGAPKLILPGKAN